MKNVIFDWSGVVKDAFVGHLWVVNMIFKKYGISEMTIDELKEEWSEPYMNFYNRYLPKMTLEEEQKIYREVILDKNYPQSNPYPGIVELIQELKNKNYYLAVVTGDFEDSLFPEIKRFGLENVFNDIKTNVHKKTETVQNLIEKNGFDRKITFFVGDSNGEIVTSNESGINSVAVTWGFTAEKTLKKDNPNFIAHNLEELKNILF